MRQIDSISFFDPNRRKAANPDERPTEGQRVCPKCGIGKMHYYIILGENKVKNKTHNLFCDKCNYAENRRSQEIYASSGHEEKV